MAALTLFPRAPRALCTHESPGAGHELKPHPRTGLERGSAIGAGSYLPLMRNFKGDPSEEVLQGMQECIYSEQMIY